MLKHKKESYSMEELLQHIQIEEQVRKRDQQEEKERIEKVHLVGGEKKTKKKSRKRNG